MMKVIGSIVGALLLVACGTGFNAISRLHYYGVDNLPFELTFDTYFHIPAKDFESELEIGKVEHIKLTKTELKLIDQRMQKHAKHLYGVFSFHTSPTDFFTNSGAVKYSFKTTLTEVDYDAEKKVYVLHYHFAGEGAFLRPLLNGKKSGDLDFYMPNDPVHLYEYIMDNTDVKDKAGEKVNPCTSRWDNTPMAFYYYWNPDDRECPKRLIKPEIHVVTGHFKQQEETKRSYPEYDQLYADKTPQHPMRVDLVYGFDESHTDPEDVGRQSWEWDAQKFRDLGWEERESDAPYEQKRFILKTDRYYAQIRLTLMDPEEKVFDDYVKDAFKKADVFIYSGHSRDDYYFNMKRLYKDEKHPLRRTKKYQIFFDNSCASYMYFNNTFFYAKQNKDDPNGTKGLDLVTNVIGAPFFVDFASYSQNYLFLMSILGLGPDGGRLRSWPSWQKILGDMAAQVDFEDTALTALLGDEDNPKSSKGFGELPRVLEQ